MVRCYRGVAHDNPQYAEALNGNVFPRGGPATPEEHNLGDTASEYTSWTTDRDVAVEKATDRDLGGRGVVLDKEFVEAEIVTSPDFYDEAEVLVRGPVTGANVTWEP